jgi:hypothetical protein
MVRDIGFGTGFLHAHSCRNTRLPSGTGPGTLWLCRPQNDGYKLASDNTGKRYPSDLSEVNGSHEHRQAQERPPFPVRARRGRDANVTHVMRARVRSSGATVRPM